MLGQAGDVWNIVSQPPNQNPTPAGRTVTLVDSTGASSGHDIFLTYSSETGSNGGSAIVGTTGPVPALMRDIIHGTPGSGGSGGTSAAQLLFTFDAPASFANQQFRVIAYASFHNTSSSGTTFFEVIDGVALGQTLGTNTALAEGVNYADFTITADSNGDFDFYSNFTPGSAVTYGPVNGFQITAIPEPFFVVAGRTCDRWCRLLSSAAELSRASDQKCKWGAQETGS